MRYDELDSKELGHNLASIRRAVGLTQEQLAERCRVSTSTLARHESGEDAPGVLLMLRYCREMGLTEGEFFRMNDDLLRARARLKEGPAWLKRLEDFEAATFRGPLEDHKATEDFAAGAAHMFGALLRTLQRP